MSSSRLTSIVSKTLRAATLARQLLQRDASVENTLRAHRFLTAINHAGRPGEADALSRFEKSGYTFDDLEGGLGFLRRYSSEEADVAGEIHRAAWAAAEERAQAGALPRLPDQPNRGVKLERLFLGRATLVVAASAAVARQACRILRETGVGGEVLPVDVFDPEFDMPAFQAVANVRALARQGGLSFPDFTVVAVLCDPVVVCAGEWGKAQEGFEAALDAAMNGDASSPLAGAFRRAVDGAGLVERAQRLLGESGSHAMSIDPAAGFAEKTCANGRCFATRLDCLHVLGLHLKSEEAAPELPDGLREPRAIDPDGMPGLAALNLRSASLERVADVCAGPLGATEDRATWIQKWSSSSGSESSIVYVFPHIPKTAGSSLAHHFREHLLGLGEYVHVRHDTDEAGIRRDRSLPFYWRDAKLRSCARVVFGHAVKRRFCDHVPGRVARELITLREPAERMISHYNFWMHIHKRRGLPVIGFDEWYAQEPRNYQVFWIAYNYLELDSWLYSQSSLHEIVDAVLEKFWMVSTLKTFDRDMQLLMRELGLPDVGERKNVGGGDRFKKLVTLTDDLRARLREENAFEYRLYDKWLERSLARHGG